MDAVGRSGVAELHGHLGGVQVKAGVPHAIVRPCLSRIQPRSRMRASQSPFLPATNTGFCGEGLNFTNSAGNNAPGSAEKSCEAEPP